VQRRGFRRTEELSRGGGEIKEVQRIGVSRVDERATKCRAYEWALGTRR
jgi:hypothetical protein